MKVFARRGLMCHGPIDARSGRGVLSDSDEALLLEGDWPDRDEPDRGDAGCNDAYRGEMRHSNAARRWTLDESIDVRYAWIDEQASYLAERIGPLPGSRNQDCAQLPGISLGYLNALRLRYYLVKLLRVVAFFQQPGRLTADSTVHFYGAANQDEDYADLLEDLSRSLGFRLKKTLLDVPRPTPQRYPANPLWRRTAGWLSQQIDRLRFRAKREPSSLSVMFCGNPAVLSGVAGELLSRGADASWLYDRFALMAWFRQSPLGVRQLWCNASQGGTNRLDCGLPNEPLVCRGVDLSRPVQRWLNQMAATAGHRQTRLVERIDQHFSDVRPDRLVLDEDATPLARAAVAVARSHGVPSFVVQHGVPCVRFGFSPLAADHFFAWGYSSSQQLQTWGVPEEKITVTGSPRHETLRREPESPRRKIESAGPRILLLDTLPPKDDRPDAVGFHLTSTAHRTMLSNAFAVVSRLPNACLEIRPHPRTMDLSVIQKLLAARPELNAYIQRDGNLSRAVEGCACVLSCASSSGVEAAALGVPVIQLWPQGSADLLPADAWGFFGAAQDELELDRLVQRALATSEEPGLTLLAKRSLLGDSDRSASSEIADALQMPGLDPTARIADEPSLISCS